MSLRKRIALVIVWMASLVAAGAWGYAQTPQQRSSKFPLFSGSDFGFRVDGLKIDPANGQIRDAPIGTFVVRINGQWWEARQAQK